VARRDDLSRIEQALTRIARVSQGREAARYRAERSGVGVSQPAVRILSALRAGGPMRLSELARRADLEAPLLSREIRNLVDGGFVERRADPGDGRVGIVKLTTLGRKATEAYRSTVEEIVGETFSSWLSPDLHVLAAYLERVAADSARRPDGSRSSK
jgi:DNA-binding MarR family transcriptional regulator